jgi:D-serine dehydratase
MMGQVWTDLQEGVPICWVRERDPITVADPEGAARVLDATQRWRRFAPLLATLFPLELPAGVIESPLLSIPHLVGACNAPGASADFDRRVFVKADHALPLAGSIKARGGIYAVLCIAERVAQTALPLGGADAKMLALPAAHALFARHRIVVGSTGNLGFAVGLAARALGFQTEVHMSQDAKTWKKERLRRLGVSVVEHTSDYSSAVAAARRSAELHHMSHFIDDESSEDLFFGYSAAAPALAHQLYQLNVVACADKPLCVYLPCGVGGAPAGVLYGLRSLMGPHVWGFFAEPTASPCMLMRLLGAAPTATVYDLGLDNKTAADGLAVARASDLAFDMIGQQVMGAYTVSDEEMFDWIQLAASTEGLRLEPAAATGFAGALDRIWRHPSFATLKTRMNAGTHIVWTTGGAQLPDQEFNALLMRSERQIRS